MLLANLLVKPFWILGIEVEVQNAVGNEAYGFYFALFSFSYIFNILLDLGVTNFNTRNIAQHPQLIGKHLSSILVIKVLLLGMYLMVTFGVGMIMGYGSEEFQLLAWLTLCQFLNSLILYLRSNFEGLLLFKWDSLFSVLDQTTDVSDEQSENTSSPISVTPSGITTSTAFSSHFVTTPFSIVSTSSLAI